MSETPKEKKVWIPPITDARLAELAERIKPLIRSKGQLYNIKPVDLRGDAYTWEPKLTTMMEGLVPLCDIRTYHTYAYYGFFKPSVAEVLAAIPNEYIDQTIAFEIVGSPETADDLNSNREALNAGYHVATTRLYGKA